MRISDWSSDVFSSDLWLFAVAGLIVLMVIVGGITRLTETGLSITEWKPISGAIPPLTHAQWVAERSEERRVGKERVSTCRSRWSPHHEKQYENKHNNAR